LPGHVKILIAFVFLLSFGSGPENGLAHDAVLQTYDRYTGSEDIAGWFLSEKLDGIRGYWDGENLFTRSGGKIRAPKWFTKGFPDFELDGELWAGRGKFHFVQKTVLDAEPSADWKKITYHIFEVPHASGNFTVRLQKAQDWLAGQDLAHVWVVPQIRCSGAEHLQHYVQTIDAVNGEGVIVKDPEKSYSQLTSDHILKYKLADRMIGTVLGINPGQGKYKNMMGSVTVQLHNGVTFNLGTGFCDAQRQDPPAIGSRVVFQYHGWTVNRKPRFATFLKVVDQEEGGQ